MAIAFDAASSNGNGGVTSISVSHTAAGSNRAAIIAVIAEGGVTISSVTYGGVACTLLRDHSDSASGVHMYRILAPNTGAQTVQANFSGSSSRCAIGVVTFTGVDQTTPFGTAVDAKTTASTTISVDASSATGEVVVDMAWVVDNNITVGAGQTAHIDQDDIAGVFRSFGMSSEAGATTTTMSWTHTTNGTNFIIAVPLKPASSSSTVTVDYAQAVFQGQAVPTGFTAPLINAQATFQGQNVTAVAGGSATGAVVHAPAVFEGQEVPFQFTVQGSEAQVVAEGSDVFFEIRITGSTPHATFQGQTISIGAGISTTITNAQAVFQASTVNLVATGGVFFTGPNIGNFSLVLNQAMTPINFSSRFTGTGLTFSAVGTLPTGLSLSSAGVLSGTPTVANTFTPIVIRATDGSNTADSNSFSIVVSSVIQARYPRWLPLILAEHVSWLRRYTGLRAAAIAEANGAAQWAKYTFFGNIKVDVHSVPGYPRPNWPVPGG